jgi:DNA adenine methylase
VISPFIGGGSVEIALSKELGIEVIGYDIFDLLVNYWKLQIENGKELYDLISKIEEMTKEKYGELKEPLRKHWKKEELLTDELELAMLYWVSHNLSYGPGFLGWWSSNYSDPKKYQNLLNKVKNFKDENLKVFCESFETSIPKHNEDFLYLDPPYFLGGDSKMFKGIYPMRNFPVHHKGFNHDLLKEVLSAHKGKFILSYNNCKEILDLYKSYNISFAEWQYTMGQGETRIGKNRIEKGLSNIKPSHELLIRNF